MPHAFIIALEASQTNETPIEWLDVRMRLACEFHPIGQPMAAVRVDVALANSQLLIDANVNCPNEKEMTV